MEGVIINEKKQVLASLNNSYKREGEFIKPNSQSELPFILFNGKTTQPDFYISTINKPKYYSINELIKILAQKSEVNSNKSKKSNWNGAYDGYFLRLKEEYADPRAWGQINLEINANNSILKVDSYLENVQYKLEVVVVSSPEKSTV